MYNIVIITKNSYEKLKKKVDTLLTRSRRPLTILVIDQASEDFTYTYLQTLFMDTCLENHQIYPEIYKCNLDIKGCIEYARAALTSVQEIHIVVE